MSESASSPPLVRKFAQLMLTEIDARLALYDELRSLRSQLAKAHQASQTANRDRTEAEARMRRIDAALAEANAKLEAVMKIERNIGPTGKGSIGGGSHVQPRARRPPTSIVIRLVGRQTDLTCRAGPLGRLPPGTVRDATWRNTMWRASVPLSSDDPLT